jgi:hypothetical protein
MYRTHHNVHDSGPWQVQLLLQVTVVAEHRKFAIFKVACQQRGHVDLQHATLLPHCTSAHQDDTSFLTQTQRPNKIVVLLVIER